MTNILEVNDDTFEDEIIKSNRPSMVDLWAPWCQPCLITGPWVEELGKKYEGEFKVAKMNVDENPMTPNKYGVRAIPTILLFKDGELADTIIGAVGKKNIENVMLKLLE
ncbi:MAG: thioredoxin [Deltaproteobacteria bacterium]|nr:thioredoxin [Deltaproteobacteria bacterium]